MHHASIRTADIFRAIAFYELLGFTVQERFTTGYTLACWLEGLGGRIELIQIPQPKPAPDAFGDEHYVGYYHLSFDLTAALAPTALVSTALATGEAVCPSAERPSLECLAAEVAERPVDLPGWLALLKQRFDQAAATQEQVQPLHVLLEPEQQMIGDRIYEVAFIADADGLPLELIRVLSNRA
jgi:catechol 2,3-dioxygenase-like lactoylglutathione lyase family enzyme